MADEVNVAGTITITPTGGRMRSFDLTCVSNMSGNGSIESRVLVGTANFALPLGNVSLPGRIVAKCLGPGNVTLQAGSGGMPMVSIGANKTETLTLANATPYIVSDVANTTLDYFVASR